ncbi:MAG: hypothetical protein ACR2NA_13500 [Solirubrobacterales bacterium]
MFWCKHGLQCGRGIEICAWDRIDDKGTITGMDAVVGQLAEAHPYLVRDDADDFDLYDDDDPDVPSGRPMNGRRQATGPANKDAELLRRYPALRRYGR